MGAKVLTRPSLPVKAKILLLATMLFATGCPSSEMSTIPPPSRIPANAIHVGEQLYMVPTGKIDKGCQMYRAFSPSHSVVAAIFYKGADGKFLIDKGKSDCK